MAEIFKIASKIAKKSTEKQHFEVRKGLNILSIIEKEKKSFVMVHYYSF